MKQTFYIFRHGLATLSTTGYGNDIFSAKILEEGIPEIKKIGNYLRTKNIDYWVRSEFLRCKQTGDIITNITGLPFTIDSRLNEFDDTNPLMNESFAKLAERISSFIEEMQKNDYKSIAICTHGAVIAGLKNLLLKKEFTLYDLRDYPKPGIIWEITEQLKQIAW